MFEGEKLVEKKFDKMEKPNNAIATKDNEEASPKDKNINPFYLMCGKIPLPLAVKQEIPEALKWRDEWERTFSDKQKSFYCFHPELRNWVGGAEDGAQAVHEAQTEWEENAWETKTRPDFGPKPKIGDFVNAFLKETISADDYPYPFHPSTSGVFVENNENGTSVIKCQNGETEICLTRNMIYIPYNRLLHEDTQDFVNTERKRLGLEPKV